ncbi:MAG TPA: BtrH N-terminal domain-containing protein [Methanocella sp.]
MNPPGEIAPFERCPALNGCHCVTNSLAKIYYHNNHPLSEDMLLGLGAGMGFIYWSPKGSYPFVGGRGNPKGFFTDLGERTGVRITETATASDKKAESALVDRLRQREPVMVFGDMGYMPWFEMPGEYHFGGHTFVICGYDGKDRVLISDMDQRASGVKKGFYFTTTLDKISIVRNSKFKPFPPKNASLSFDFDGYHDPTPDGIYASIKQTAEAMLSPPIKNLGIRGIRHTAKEILKWPDLYHGDSLIMNLFNVYIFIEIGGTGGGCFRYMYARFLKEAAELTGDNKLLEAAALFDQSGRLFSQIGLLFKDYEDRARLQERITEASATFTNIADIEEKAFHILVGNRQVNSD